MIVIIHIIDNEFFVGFTHICRHRVCWTTLTGVFFVVLELYFFFLVVLNKLVSELLVCSPGDGKHKVWGEALLWEK